MMRNPRPEEQLRGGNEPWERKRGTETESQSAEKQGGQSVELHLPRLHHRSRWSAANSTDKREETESESTTDNSPKFPNVFMQSNRRTYPL